MKGFEGLDSDEGFEVHQVHQLRLETKDFLKALFSSEIFLHTL